MTAMVSRITELAEATSSAEKDVKRRVTSRDPAVMASKIARTVGVGEVNSPGAIREDGPNHKQWETVDGGKASATRSNRLVSFRYQRQCQNYLKMGKRRYSRNEVVGTEHPDNEALPAIDEQGWSLLSACKASGDTGSI